MQPQYTKIKVEKFLFCELNIDRVFRKIVVDENFSIIFIYKSRI